ncbi:MAG: FtsQ-type POTRA domain-containing protein, partial [Candidatus Eremiobacteraeota bacterium]|nr:FtsQ-type POTRA domain-containing protein [Candidatus Eremiobacteraeota bacterium]
MKTDAGSARPRARTVPRRRKTSFAARVKPFWIFLIVLVGLAGWGGAWLVQSPWFRVTRVGVDVPLASPVSSNTVRAAAGISRENNLWLIDTRAAARRIEDIPYVQTATIRRAQFPKPVVELAITVRRPSACVRG